MKVSVNPEAGSKIQKLRMDDCLKLAEEAQRAVCGLAYASHQLSKTRADQAFDKAVQVVDVSTGLATAASHASRLAETLKSSGSEGLAKQARKVSSAASRINREIRKEPKKAGATLGRVEAMEVGKLQNDVRKLEDSINAIWQQTKVACGVKKAAFGMVQVTEFATKLKSPASDGGKSLLSRSKSRR